MAAAQSGDADALDRMLRRLQPTVHAVCLRITGNPTDAADAAQEALIGIARGLGRFDGRSRFTTWAYRVATNAALDELRRRRRRPVAVELTEAEMERARVPVADDLGGVAERLDAGRALARLPVDYRAAVVLRDLCALDYAEIGEVLGIPPGTVRSRIARGRAALAPLLAEPGTGGTGDDGSDGGNRLGAERRPTI
ncbi:MAG TPA: RNA polymerase sigma factor [Acidimicrobiales bacterium]|nr:RNA polymerase sigma factor [Acidimicrobiales bacterium]